VRDEEIDWCVYRLIADGDTDAVSGILDCTQFEIPVVEASLARLMRAGLITREENHLCILLFRAPWSMLRPGMKIAPSTLNME
jgi:hypothetical protein